MRSRYGVDTIKLATVLPNKGETKKLYRRH